MDHANAQSHFGAAKMTCDAHILHLDYRAALARTKKKRSLRKAEDKMRLNKKTENHKKLRLKRGDENELERYLRL